MGEAFYSMEGKALGHQRFAKHTVIPLTYALDPTLRYSVTIFASIGLSMEREFIIRIMEVYGEALISPLDQAICTPKQ
jgi:hypothetical protein